MNDTPIQPTEEEQLRAIQAAIVRLRTGILAFVFALVSGGLLWLATVWLLIRGGERVGEHLNLLGNFLPGYSVTWTGSLLGLFYGGIVGGSIGWLIATIYNRMVSIRKRRHRRRHPKPL